MFGLIEGALLFVYFPRNDVGYMIALPIDLKFKKSCF